MHFLIKIFTKTLRQLFLVFLAHILGNQDTRLKVATVSDDPGSKPRQSEERGKTSQFILSGNHNSMKNKDEEEGGGEGEEEIAAEGKILEES